ncbi:MAG: cytochrome c oxidase assembly protein [Rhodobacteraceae bacterium]|jgi:cytochrome c oxidase assembly protein subunit 11|nr:cytochrome c oxidase assembly protein [Paracoccaceae bacterium]
MIRLDGPKRTAVILTGVAGLMLGLSFAAVPFYNWFCRVTGYGGEVAVSDTGADRILDRRITVRFDASREAGMPWEFRPLQTEMDIRIGETGLAFYEAYNPTDHPVAGQASYNVAPDVAGGYFTKIHCFCFEMQVLQPGERVEMPVTFYVDPAIMDDIDGQNVEAITLSYTFHTAELPMEQAAMAPVAGPPTGEAGQPAASN